LAQRVGWLASLSRSGISRLLHRFGLRFKRSRPHIHSPDPAYAAKCAALQSVLTTAAPQHVVVFLDEVAVHRQPTPARAYAARGDDQPRAEQSLKEDTEVRVLATLDAQSGRVCAWQRRRVTVATQVGFYQALVAAYPAATTITVVLDNWPVHFHPDLLVALEPQQTPFPLRTPPSWPKQPHKQAIAKWGDLHLPIQFLPLPTYASWLNPIEKLWRWLRQAVGHLHPFADDLPALETAIARFLARFDHDAPDLLEYVGL
jgi:hypothetical protein